MVQGSSVKIYCSAECLKGEVIPIDDLIDEVKPEGALSRVRPVVAGGALIGMLFVSDTRLPQPPPPPAPVVDISALIPKIPLPPEPARPPTPTIEEEWVAEILRDVWIHPLGGPVRRMPIRDSRVFGAERPGERPPECNNGHCGVDIGGEIWGEPVLAVHDGLVDRVVRGPNEDRGGLYVRLSHRNGTVFTQYFHLAAIPRWIAVGRTVSAGEVIGLVGDSGVKNSGPHLHFTISVKPSAGIPETFIDPEPLIALWPLRMPGEQPHPAAPVPALSIDSSPGMVRGARPKKAKKRVAASIAPTTEPDSDPASEPAPASAPDPAPAPDRPVK